VQYSSPILDIDWNGYAISKEHYKQKGRGAIAIDVTIPTRIFALGHPI